MLLHQNNADSLPPGRSLSLGVGVDTKGRRLGSRPVPRRVAADIKLVATQGILALRGAPQQLPAAALQTISLDAAPAPARSRRHAGTVETAPLSLTPATVATDEAPPTGAEIPAKRSRPRGGGRVGGVGDELSALPQLDGQFVLRPAFAKAEPGLAIARMLPGLPPISARALRVAAPIIVLLMLRSMAAGSGLSRHDAIVISDAMTQEDRAVKTEGGFDPTARTHSDQGRLRIEKCWA